MSQFTVTIDISRARDAVGRIPAEVVSAVEVQLARGAIEVATDAQRRAPKALSGLWTSFQINRITSLHYQVEQMKNYGRAVEEGTPPHFPNPDNLRPWVERVLGVRGKEARDKAFLIARAISRRGTRAQPYMQPAAEANRSWLFELVAMGVDEGLKRAMA